MSAELRRQLRRQLRPLRVGWRRYVYRGEHRTRRLVAVTGRGIALGTLDYLAK